MRRDKASGSDNARHFDGYPLTVGEIYGTRSWNMKETRNGPVLTGVTYQEYWWKPGINTAVCRLSGDVCEDDSHQCGLWAYHNGDTWGLKDITGIVRGYGRTTIGTKGFRSEKAEIVAFVRPETATWKTKILLAAGWLFVLLLLAAISVHAIMKNPDTISPYLFAIFFTLITTIEYRQWRNREHKYKIFDQYAALHPQIPVFNTMQEAQKRFPVQKQV